MSLSEERRFEDLYSRYGKHVYAYCARRAGNVDVSDLVAEVFLVAWRRMDQVPAGEGCLPWLYGVAFRVLNHRFRSFKRRTRAVERLESLAAVELDVPPDVLLVQRDEYRLVREAASRLKAIDQEILRLTLWEELTHKQAAQVLGIEVGAVKERAHRARHRLGVEYRRLAGEPANPPLFGREVPQ